MTTATETLNGVAKLIQSGKLDRAAKTLEGTTETDDNRAELTFLRGYLAEMSFDRATALDTYLAMTESHPDHVEATFRAAFLCDQHGDDDKAIELYERCAEQDPVHVNALINLSVLYEEHGRLDMAERCLGAVLDEHPDHFRARHLLKSVKSSHTMVFDEHSQQEQERHYAVLDMPVGDFELSVRSRNCLRQMNIATLGDLLKTTEAELLSYKNFGDTSLTEIKALLAQKNLHLGQSLPTAGVSMVGGTAPAMGQDSLHSSRSVSELELSVRSRKALQRLGTATLGELCERSESELMTIKNFGLTSLTEIKRELAKQGLSLRQAGD